MRMYDILLKKRDGLELTDGEIEFFVSGYTAGKIPDYQASALCMAICLKGMNERETATLTDAMARSGDTVDLSCFGALSADKHSTGGVGDKTSLIVGPIVASLGGKVTKMSGRGLGHTGGTVDKLEAIPGYRINLTNEEFISQVDKVGMAIIGQSGNLTPADKKLYALRDVTATVDSIPLITSSIMSKKIASGSQTIVLDVKVGSGAFMKTPEEARLLAENMVKIGRRCKRKTAALLTDMNSPLGNAVGNALEIKEAVAVLKGEQGGDIKEVCLALSGAMLSLIYGISFEEGTKKAKEALTSGKAFEKMREWITAQGGDVSCIDDTSLFPKPLYEYEVKSTKSGYITAMDAEKIGKAAVILGAGRKTKDDGIDYSAGIVIDKKTGDRVSVGDRLCTLYTNDKEAIEEAKDRYISSLTFDKNKKEANPLIYEIIN